MANENPIDLSMFSDNDELFNEEPIEGAEAIELDANGNSVTPELDPPKGAGDGIKEPEKPKEPEEIIEPDDVTEPSEEEGKQVKLVYKNVAELLKSEGMFDEDTDLKDIESPERLVEALREEIKRNEFSDLSELQSEYLQAIREGIPDKLFLQHKQTEASYNNITEEMIANNEELRKNIIMADLTSKGMNADRATKFYKTVEASGEDISEAVSSLTNLKALDKERYDAEVLKNQQLIEQKKAEEKNKVKKLKDSVYNTKEIIKDIKITEKLRDKVYETMTKTVAYSEAGQPMNKLVSDREKDAIGFDTKLAYVYTMTKGFTDFSSFKRNATSKAARELERVVLEGGNSLNIGTVPNLTVDNETDIPQITELSDE